MITLSASTDIELHEAPKTASLQHATYNEKHPLGKKNSKNNRPQGDGCNARKRACRRPQARLEHLHRRQKEKA